ncbi:MULTISPECIES: hypothetical protein [Brevibacillus]|jgi:hypothetical protein|uniref:Hydrolase n=1 Tax=Brevibacillus parabrevis TaxID=54914 RepID=A0A4Y3PMG4_BREPA|nr:MULTISPECIES: hypothetical protein [Brevibacillus]TGV14241.1 hypothetical protein EN829_049525 [Mesorhizobium sp. M00.F.Ca.ET.186.01.1.1]MBU8713771.1 hypothetical protein [Brevibacillus parabrevis]MDH6350771.1 hypothetical protein [Brevibacillus sp. 1238]MDR4998181.1 hypothetical protein [Brevibacillus parabrevis]MED1723200.1 hypothetical protein [Brevibacillus parabrevis]
MDKKRYYVSVQAGTIMENQGDSAYEFEIEATDLQVHALKSLFEQRTETEFDTFIRGHALAVPYHFDAENDLYDDCLTQIYRAIYECGTEETKQHIQSMGILNG